MHATGPNGGYSISGGMTFENLFLLNGVTINENLRGQPHDLYIEDAIQETIVASAGVSAEFGRFGGGVVNVDHQVRRQPLQRVASRHAQQRRLARADAVRRRHATAKDLLPTYEYTLGGPIMRNRLWFFTAGRLQSTAEGRTLATTNGAYDFTNVLRRYEGKATYSMNSRARLESGYTRSTEQKTNESQSAALVMDRNSLFDTTRDMNLFTVNYYGILTPRLSVEARYSVAQRNHQGLRRPVDRSRRRHAAPGPSRSFRRYWSPTFCGVCDPEERDNQNLFVKGSYFLTTAGAGSHNTVVRIRRLQRSPVREQPSIRQRLSDLQHLGDHHRRNRHAGLPQRTDDGHPVESDSRRQSGDEFPDPRGSSSATAGAYPPG